MEELIPVGFDQPPPDFVARIRIELEATLDTVRQAARLPWPDFDSSNITGLTMSSLENKPTKFNLGRGYSWNAVITIETTGESRRKVIWEMCADENKPPCFRILLNSLDQLCIEVEDVNGKKDRTPYVNPELFAFRPVHLRADIVPKEDKFILKIEINGKCVSEKVISGKYDFDVENGKSSLGSALNNVNPATFLVGEIVVYAPKNDDSNAKLLGDYFERKWNLKQEVE